MRNNEFASRVLEWFDQHGRHDLPWQQADVYIRWISEVMLQQTQVQTVIPYFYRFIERFPNVQILALANEDEVLKQWSGLGYYTRARNIHKAARLINEEFGGVLPQSMDEWLTLPGIGRSTAAAIIAQATDTPLAILDANVKRVLARHAGVFGHDSATEKKLWQISENCLPKLRGADFAQGIMDLGATVCIPKDPHCQSCPVRENCYAYHNDAQPVLPSKKVKPKISQKTEHWALIYHQSKVLLVKNNAPTGVWRGMWCLPSFSEAPNAQDLIKFAGKLIPLNKTTQICHRFSHYALIANIHYWSTDQPVAHLADSDTTLWYDVDEPADIGIPKPVTNLLTK